MTYKTILVIDDENSICLTLRGILTDEGYNVLTIGSAEDALKIIEEELPDLVLLDIWLPGMDGIEALKIIKRDYPQIQIIMMSGHHDNLYLGIIPFDDFQRLNSVHTRQPDIQQHKIWQFFFNDFECVFSTPNGEHIISLIR